MRLGLIAMCSACCEPCLMPVAIFKNSLYFPVILDKIGRIFCEWKCQMKDIFVPLSLKNQL